MAIYFRRAQAMWDRASKAVTGANNTVRKLAPSVNQAYRSGKAAFDSAVSQSDQMFDMMSTADSVSDNEADAVLRSLGIKPKAARSNSAPSRRAAPLRKSSVSRTRSASAAGQRKQTTSSSSFNRDASRVMKDAKRAEKSGNRWLNKNESKINAEYKAVSAEVDRLGGKLDAIQDAFLRPMPSLSVSSDAVDKLLAQSTSEIMASLPDVSHLPAPSHSSKKSVAPAKPTRKSTPAPKPKPAPKVTPKPATTPTAAAKSSAQVGKNTQGKIADLTEKVAVFSKMSRRLKAKKPLLDNLKLLKNAVVSIDRLSDSNHKAEFNQIQRDFKAHFAYKRGNPKPTPGAKAKITQTGKLLDARVKALSVKVSNTYMKEAKGSQMKLIKAKMDVVSEQKAQHHSKGFGKR